MSIQLQYGVQGAIKECGATKPAFNVLSQVQALANEGHIIVPAWYNPDPDESGHVALVVPGSMEYSLKWGCNMPMTMETGAGNKSPRKKMSYGFGKETKGTIKFFRYIGPIKK